MASFRLETIRQRGSHVILKKVSLAETVGCVVPLHKELAIGTLVGILRQAKVTPEKFMENI
ncbi:MAG: type II toxin-antitoxin system HicA family toxin [Candidatus Omnitrophota bacterium]